ALWPRAEQPGKVGVQDKRSQLTPSSQLPGHRNSLSHKPVVGIARSYPELGGGEGGVAESYGGVAGSYPLLTIVLAVLVGLTVLSLRWVRLNTQPSVTLGLYLLHTVRAPLARGTLVLLSVPASVQRWLSPWTPILKPVAAVAGDTVCVGDERLVIAGQ